MIASLQFDSAQLWQLAGWTMVHFLWLGTAAAAVALLCRLLLRSASPNLRYAAAVSCFLLLAAMPIAIAAWLAQNSPPPLKGGARGGIASTTQQVATPEVAEQDIVELHAQTQPTTAPHANTKNNAIVVPPTTTEPSAAPVTKGLGIPWALLQQCVPYLPWLWIIGTPITFGLLAAGLVGTRRLRQSCRAIDDSQLAGVLKRVCASLRIRARVGIAVCDRIGTPVLIGILRPMILLPPAALTGWSPDEIEMVLLHELAHVRRWDNLVNLLQRCIESLLFFHPAVWLVSSWVRREREACCDAIVVGRTQRPHAYAELLVALAAQMPRKVLFHPAAASAMAAGPLRSRIRRILQLDDDPMLISGKSFALMLAGLVVAATLAVLYLPTIGQAEDLKDATASATSQAASPPLLVDPNAADERVTIESNLELSLSEETPKSAPNAAVQSSPPASQDRILEAYEIPANLIEEVRKLADSRNVRGFRDGRGRLVLQTSRAEHDRFKSLLEATPKWLAPAAARAREKQPVVMSTSDGEPVLEWRTAGLTFMRNPRTEQPPGGSVEIINVAPGSPADWQNIATGDALISVDNLDVGSLEELKTVIEALLDGFPNESKLLRLRILHSQNDGDNGRLRQYNKQIPLRPDGFDKVDAQPAAKAAAVESAGLTAAADAPPYVLPTPEDEDNRPKSRSKIPGADSNKRLKTDSAAPAVGAATSKKSLRYDDKTFDQWRSLWKNELSFTKRTEAVKALAAFGRAGYGKEATAAILDVAGEYDFNILTNDAEGKLKEAVMDELLPDSGSDDLAKYWMPDLAARLKQDPEKWTGLTWNLMGRLRTNDPEILAIVQSLVADRSPDVRSTALSALIRSSKSTQDGRLSLDDQTRKLMTDALKSGDPIMVHAVLAHLIRYPQNGTPGQALHPILIFQPELVPLLFHEDQHLQKRVRGLIQYIDRGDAPKVVEQLTSELQDRSPERRLAAIHALAAVGDKAQSALPSLKKLVNSSSDRETLVATYVALEEINRDESEGRSAPYNVHLFVEGLDEKDKKAVLEKIDAASPSFIENMADESAKIVPKNDPSWSSGGGGYGGGGFF